MKYVDAMIDGKLIGYEIVKGKKIARIWNLDGSLWRCN